MLCLPTLYSQSYLSSSTTSILACSSLHRSWGGGKNFKTVLWGFFYRPPPPPPTPPDVPEARPATNGRAAEEAASPPDSALSPPLAPAFRSPDPRRLSSGGASDWTGGHVNQKVPMSSYDEGLTFKESLREAVIFDFGCTKIIYCHKQMLRIMQIMKNNAVNSVFFL